MQAPAEPRSSQAASLAIEPQGEPHLALEPFVPWYLLVPLAAALVAAAVASYRRTTRPVPLARRVALNLLRTFGLLAILVCLVRPLWVQEVLWREKGLCFLALDASSSMNLRDAPQGLTRWEFARRLLAKHQPELAALAQQYEVRRFLFDAVPSETPALPGEAAAPDPGRPAGRSTDLAALQERLAAEAAGTPCAGILLLTDGRHNVPRDPLPAVRALRRVGAPIFAVGLGQEATPADYREVQVRLLEVPERAFVQTEVTFRVEVESQLPAPARVPFTLTVNGEKAKEEVLALPPGREITRLEVRYTPTALGTHRVVAAVASLPEEANVNNNTRTAYFRVFRSKLGVWYVEGTLRKEFGALRAALATAPNLSLRAFNAFVARSEEDPSLLPQSEDQWKELRLMILGDLPAQRFTAEQLRRLARFVEEGGAVLMLGGLTSFGAGGWHQSPLAGVLPVEMDWRDEIADGPFALAPAADALAHPAARLSDDPGLSGELWARLPPLPSVNQVAGIKPAAKVLVRAGGYPLLVVQDYGRGRSAVFGADATWQWVIKAGQGEAQKFFWRNLATWLTRSEYRDAGKAVFVEADRLQYLLGDEATLGAQVQVTEPTRGRIEQALLRATLAVEGGAKKTWELGRGPGEYSSRQSPQSPGSYTFKVEAVGPAGEVLGQDSIGFQVELLDVEQDNPNANLRLLRNLANQSGGLYYDAEHAAEAFPQLLQRPSGFAKPVRQSTELWNHWLLFALCVVCVTAEWTMRKRWGLA